MAAPVAVATSLPAPSSAPTAVPPPERSPWAPPSTVPPVNAPGPMAGAQAAVAAAAPEVAKVPPSVVTAPTVPVPAAPVVAAPVVAAPASTKPPVVSNAPSGKKKSDKEGGDSKGKFRETMWFKKGELDAQAAQAIAEADKAGKDVADKGDSLPLDERYKDDGSITRGDKEKYSLRTGATQMMKSVKEDASKGSGTRVSEDALIGEMKGGRQWIFIALGVGILVVILIIVLVTR
jgi:hypothetical protein